MAESRRLQHCCKGRHCCRDGSCEEVITIVDEEIPEPVERENPIPGGGVLDSGGWAMPSEAVYDFQGRTHPLEFPKVQIKRGGIYFPRYLVETMVQPARKRFLRRRMWQLHIRYWEPENHKNMHHVMVFASEHDARNAEEIMKFTVKNINDQVEEEKRAR